MSIAMTYFAMPNVLVSALKKTQNETYIKTKNVTKRRLKISATVKKDDFIFSKIGQYRANLISRIEFVSTVSYKFLPNTHTCISLFACIYDATCHFCNCAILRTSNSELRDLISEGLHFKNIYKFMVINYHDVTNKGSICWTQT